jgi:hypothetical protein
VKRHIALLSTVLALLALALPAVSSAALPANFWGVVANEAPSAAQAQVLGQGGVESLRVPINWASVKPSRGSTPQWGAVDPFIRSAAEAGLSVLPYLAGAPKWALHYEGVGGTTAPTSLPVQTGVERKGWKEFLRLVVSRYGPGGSFWAANPLLPAHPIRVWQIWNEENFKYFAARPNPSQYGRLVVESFRDLRSADRGAKIVLGGLFLQPKGGNTKPRRGQIKRAYFATDFLEQMYRSTPAVRGKFIAIALHPYSSSFSKLTGEIKEVRRTLKKLHDPSRALWLTEMGWSSDRPDAANGHNRFEKGPRGQSREMAGAFRLLRSRAHGWHIKRVYWFSYSDSPGTCNFCDGSGLFRPNQTPKPAWTTFERFAR